MDAPGNVQEAQMQKLEAEYEQNLPQLKALYPNINPNKAKALQHFLGLPDTIVYIETLVATGDADKAQAAVEASQKKRGNTYSNLSIQDYLSKFANPLN